MTLVYLDKPPCPSKDQGFLNQLPMQPSFLRTHSTAMNKVNRITSSFLKLRVISCSSGGHHDYCTRLESSNFQLHQVSRLEPYPCMDIVASFLVVGAAKKSVWPLKAWQSSNRGSLQWFRALPGYFYIAFHLCSAILVHYAAFFGRSCS